MIIIIITRLTQMAVLARMGWDIYVLNMSVMHVVCPPQSMHDGTTTTEMCKVSRDGEERDEEEEAK